MELVEIVKSTLTETRNESSNEFRNIFEEAKTIAEELDVDVRIPRITSVQRNRANAPKKDPEDFFRVNLYLPYLDFLIAELNLRFDNQSNKVIGKLQKIIPKLYFDYNCPDDEIIDAARLYETDLPSTIDALSGELLLWKEFWRKKEEKAETPMDAFKCSSMFPSIQCLLKILCVLPITTSTAERSFSALKRIKTHLRSTMGQERLNGLSMLNICKDIKVEPEEVLDVFAKRHSRKLQLHSI